MIDPQVKVKRGSYKMRKLCTHIMWSKHLNMFMCSEHRALDQTLLPCPYTKEYNNSFFNGMNFDEIKAYAKEACEDME